MTQKGFKKRPLNEQDFENALYFSDKQHLTGEYFSQGAWIIDDLFEGYFFENFHLICIENSGEENLDPNSSDLLKTVRYTSPLQKGEMSRASMSGSIFQNCKFVNVLFERVDFVHCDFKNCHFENVVFRNCHTQGIEFMTCTSFGKGLTIVTDKTFET
ncbi:MAG: pentapeptide repeat-containing protein [Candidatus Gracilibacteria bacterium]|nr:pentapeptide repeat-containing protein [Candidatus Peregrinibacteria bacterium]